MPGSRLKKKRTKDSQKKPGSVGTIPIKRSCPCYTSLASTTIIQVVTFAYFMSDINVSNGFGVAAGLVLMLFCIFFYYCLVVNYDAWHSLRCLVKVSIVLLSIGFLTMIIVVCAVLVNNNNSKYIGLFLVGAIAYYALCMVSLVPVLYLFDESGKIYTPAPSVSPYQSFAPLPGSPPQFPPATGSNAQPSILHLSPLQPPRSPAPPSILYNAPSSSQLPDSAGDAHLGPPKVEII